jgi:hypothetical protein
MDAWPPSWGCFDVANAVDGRRNCQGLRMKEAGGASVANRIRVPLFLGCLRSIAQ